MCFCSLQGSQLPVCVFWDASAAGTQLAPSLAPRLVQCQCCECTGGKGNWSEGGCQEVQEQDRHDEIVVCRCHHLSSFGVLVVCANICILDSRLSKPQHWD